MRPARIVEIVRMRRATIVLAVAAALTATATAVGATSAVGPPAELLNYQTYIGGKGKAKANLSPVTLGFINTQGGPPNLNFPQSTRVMEAGVKMINAEFGGVHGHPLKLNSCYVVQADEEGVRCAQQMLNDKGTNVVVFGTFLVGNQAFYGTMKGQKPMVGGVGFGAADPVLKNGYFLNGSQTTVLPPFATYTRRFLPKVKTVAIVYPNQAGADTAALELKKDMQQIGRKVTLIATPANATDLLGPVTQASSADMIIPATGFTECVPFARALGQIHYTKPVLATPLCTALPRAAYADGDFPRWTFGIAQTLVNIPGPQSKLYLKNGLKYGASVPDMLWVFSETTWGELLTTVKIMNKIPFAKLSPGTIATGFKAFRGPLVLGAPKVACGKIDPKQPAVCAGSAQFYNYVGKGKWKPASTWLEAPKGK